MNARQKEVEKIMPFITNKRVKLFNDRTFKEEPFLIGTVTGFTGTYLLLKDTVSWNGSKKEEEMLHTNWFTKIEIEQP